MKFFLTTAVLLFISSVILAQTSQSPAVKDTTPPRRGTVNICTFSRNRLLMNTAPLYIVYVDNKIVFRSDTSKAAGNVLGKIDQQAIKSMDIVKDSTATQRFGKAGQWGVIEIYLDGVNHPDAYKVLSKSN